MVKSGFIVFGETVLNVFKNFNGSFLGIFKVLILGFFLNVFSFEIVIVDFEEIVSSWIDAYPISFFQMIGATSWTVVIFFLHEKRNKIKLKEIEILNIIVDLIITQSLDNE